MCVCTVCIGLTVYTFIHRKWIAHLHQAPHSQSGQYNFPVGLYSYPIVMAVSPSLSHIKVHNHNFQMSAECLFKMLFPI